MRDHARTIYIHIGAPKTGTTMLQKRCFMNRAELLDQGILYPDISLRGYGHHDLAFLLSGGYPDWATQHDVTLDDMSLQMADVMGTTGQNILISSENFFLYPAPEHFLTWLTACGLRSSDHVKIIVYVRRQDLAIESWYNQTIKAQGSVDDFQTCCTTWRHLWNYDSQLARWQDVFGKHALVIRPYEESQFYLGSLAEDFFGIIGLPAAPRAADTSRVNSGLNKTILEFQRLINSLPVPIVQKRSFHHSLIELSAKAAGAQLFDETPLLTTQRRKEILAEYALGNRRVANAFLGRDQLFTETIDESDQTPETIATLGPEQLTYILGWLLLNTTSDRGTSNAKK